MTVVFDLDAAFLDTAGEVHATAESLEHVVRKPNPPQAARAGQEISGPALAHRRQIEVLLALPNELMNQGDRGERMRESAQSKVAAVGNRAHGFGGGHDLAGCCLGFQFSDLVVPDLAVVALADHNGHPTLRIGRGRNRVRSCTALVWSGLLPKDTILPACRVNSTVPPEARGKSYIAFGRIATGSYGSAACRGRERRFLRTRATRSPAQLAL